MVMESVSFINLSRPDEIIFFVLCMVHGLKAIRNQFYIRQEPPKGKRMLINNKGFQINRENLVDLYHLVEKIRMSQGMYKSYAILLWMQLNWIVGRK